MQSSKNYKIMPHPIFAILWCSSMSSIWRNGTVSNNVGHDSRNYFLTDLRFVNFSRRQEYGPSEPPEAPKCNGNMARGRHKDHSKHKTEQRRKRRLHVILSMTRRRHASVSMGTSQTLAAASSYPRQPQETSRYTAKQRRIKQTNFPCRFENFTDSSCLSLLVFEKEGIIILLNIIGWNRTQTKRNKYEEPEITLIHEHYAILLISVDGRTWKNYLESTTQLCRRFSGRDEEYNGKYW